MKTYFNLEFRKNLFSWKSIISILVIILSFLPIYLEDLRFPMVEIDGIEYFLRISSASYTFFIAPVVAGIIYSTSIVNDKKTGFMDKLLEVIDIKTYYKVKLLVNTLVSAIVLGISHGIMILYLIVFYGVKNRAFTDVAPGSFVLFGDISKISYIILIFLVIPFSAAAFSTFILGITTAVGKKFVGYILPVFYALFTGILFELWQINSFIDFNIGKLFTIGIYPNVKIFYIVIYDSIFIVVGIFLLYKFGYKRTLSLYGKR